MTYRICAKNINQPDQIMVGWVPEQATRQRVGAERMDELHRNGLIVLTADEVADNEIYQTHIVWVEVDE